MTSEVTCGYELRIRLEATATWIQVPEHLIMLQSGKTVSVHIDPRRLVTGHHVHYIRGYDTSQPREHGSLFQIPITVIIPEVMVEGTTSLELGKLTLAPGERLRKFIVPPRGCSYIDLLIHDPRQPARAVARVPSDVIEAENIELLDDEVNVTEAPAGMTELHFILYISTILIYMYILHIGMTAVTEVSNMSNVSNMNDDDAGRMIVIHALQLFRGTPYRYVTLSYTIAYISCIKY